MTGADYLFSMKCSKPVSGKFCGSLTKKSVKIEQVTLNCPEDWKFLHDYIKYLDTSLKSDITKEIFDEVC